MTNIAVRNIEDLQAAAESTLITPTQLGKAGVSGVIGATQPGEAVLRVIVFKARYA